MPKGLICPLLTPLKSDGQIDVVGLTQLWEHVSPSVAGISLGSSFSLEGVYLNDEQKQTLFKLVLGLWDGKPSLFLDITTSDEKTTFKLAQFTTALFESYLDKVIIEILPLWYRSNRGLPQYLDRLHKQTGATFIIANHPKLVSVKKRVLKHADIRTSVFKKVVQRKFVRGIIFQGALTRFLNYQRALHGRTDFTFYEGDEVSFLTRPSSDGVVALTANLVPQMWQSLIEDILNVKGQANKTNLAKVFTLGKELKTLHEICELSPGVIKWSLMQLGILTEVHSPFPTSLKGDILNRLKIWLNKNIREGRQC